MNLVRTEPVTDLDRRRLRVAWRVLLGGVLLGVAGATALALLGLDGRVGFAAVSLGTALGCVAAGLATVGLAIVDEARRDPVATRRIVVAVALFVAGALLLTMVLALAGVNR
jgi:hypothetical protein